MIKLVYQNVQEVDWRCILSTQIFSSSKTLDIWSCSTLNFSIKYTSTHARIRYTFSFPSKPKRGCEDHTNKLCTNQFHNAVFNGGITTEVANFRHSDNILPGNHDQVEKI